MKRKMMLIILSLANITAGAQSTLNILSYGAKVGLKNNASYIQKAIDEASNRGGGKVIVPTGNFVTGPLLLKNNVELHLTENAVLLGSADRMDFSAGKMAVVTAINQENVSITGKGIIDGQAHELIVSIYQALRDGKVQDEQWLTKRPTEANRTNLLFFKGCKKVKVSGISLKDAVSWVQNYKECNDVTIDSIRVSSTAYWNNDGIDIVDSKNVKITNSYFNAADDAICLKSEILGGSCEDIWVENCILRSSASGFKIGTGSIGGFKNITVKNLVVFDTYRSAVALETVDGAFMENINISGIKARNTGNALFIRLGHRNADDRYSSIKNILIDNVQVEVPSGKPDIGYPIEGPPPKVLPHNLLPASITGLPGHLVENVILSNFEIVYGGGADKNKAYISLDSLSKVPENAAGYPEFTMFSELPSWGLYVRHAKGIKLSNFRVSNKQMDFRPTMVFDDVTGLTLDQVSVPNENSLPALVYKSVTNVINKGFRGPKSKDTILIKK
ncbi:glycoside hydrolase family 28 protein [Pedobacter sp. UBA5917]|jgi:polygalacturonase|uniref:glycoside hydrolase family 28 protein n=1 Tax=Pedobacter sp. UBA5917 TaxID=1947061 RepID=UPI0025CBE44F|nr:glycosyl hydrolase family 28 protein [Pedobacter sp. UBA5917]